jgi:hypothetical protein
MKASTRSQPQSPLTVILSPHFDDAVLSLGGVLSQRVNETIVVTIFGGNPAPAQLAEGWAAAAGFGNSDMEITTRTMENARALCRYGARAHDLSYLDFPYRDKSDDALLPLRIAQDITAILEPHSLRRVFLYGPAALPLSHAHPDHRIVHDAFLVVSTRICPMRRSVQRLERTIGFCSRPLIVSSFTNVPFSLRLDSCQRNSRVFETMPRRSTPRRQRVATFLKSPSDLRGPVVNVLQPKCVLAKSSTNSNQRNNASRGPA